MMLRLLLVGSLLLSSCGYHLVGQGPSMAIPDGVVSASLEPTESVEAQNLSTELYYQWLQKTSLPTLTQGEEVDKHVTLRVEQAKVSFTPSAFDATGLAIQYRLSISGVLSMYHLNAQIWNSRVVQVSADIFEANDPSIAEAEKERLTEILNQKWANDVLARLQSGF